MDNLETSLTTTVDKARGRASGSIAERFIKPRSSTMFGRSDYYLDGTGTLVVVSVPHEHFSKVPLGYG